MVTAPYSPMYDIENSTAVCERLAVALQVLRAGVDIDLNRLLFVRSILEKLQAEEWKVQP